MKINKKWIFNRESSFGSFSADFRFRAEGKKVMSRANLIILQLKLWLEPAQLGLITTNCTMQIKFQQNCTVQFSSMILHQILIFDLTRSDLDKINNKTSLTVHAVATYRTLLCNSTKTSEPNIHQLIESESSFSFIHNSIRNVTL